MTKAHVPAGFAVTELIIAVVLVVAGLKRLLAGLCYIGKTPTVTNSASKSQTSDASAAKQPLILLPSPPPPTPWAAAGRQRDAAVETNINSAAGAG